MALFSSFLSYQGQCLLQNRRNALFFAFILAVLPYTAWLALSVIALVTLRKGCTEGSMLLAVSFITYFLTMLISTSPLIALMNALLVFVPGYIAACTLYWTSRWRAVAGVLFLLFVFVVFVLQMFYPDMIMAQYLYLQMVLQHLSGDHSVFEIFNQATGLKQRMFANYLLGLQFIGILCSAGISLLLARYVQSMLFYPGGFLKEVLCFRGQRWELLLLLFLFIAANQHYAIAVSLLPVLVFYFVLTGLCLSFNVFGKQRSGFSTVLIVLSLVFLPFIMLPVYAIFGSLDSLFNLRLYLPSDAGKVI